MYAEQISSADRLSLTLFIAMVLHALVIFGVGFTWHMDKHPNGPLIEITLATRPTKSPPKKYDFLAQANQDGGGHSKQPMKPKSPDPTFNPLPTNGQQAIQAAPMPSQPLQRSGQHAITATNSSSTTMNQPVKDASPAQPKLSALDVYNASAQVARADNPATDLGDFDAKYPSKRYIDASTRSFAAASYMLSWVHKVEQVGNLNYPDDARRRKLSGRLILSVTLRPDGTVAAIHVLRPSRYKILDAAAIRVVNLAAPFSPIPPEVLQGKDQLVITRTWKFLDSNRLSTGG